MIKEWNQLNLHDHNFLSLALTPQKIIATILENLRGNPFIFRKEIKTSLEKIFDLGRETLAETTTFFPGKGCCHKIDLLLATATTTPNDDALMMT